MTDFELMRQEMAVFKYDHSLSIEESLLKQAQIYANRSYVYGYQLRLIIDAIEMDLSIANDDLHMPLVHKAISRLREFFFVGK